MFNFFTIQSKCWLNRSHFCTYRPKYLQQLLTIWFGSCIFNICGFPDPKNITSHWSTFIVNLFCISQFKILFTSSCMEKFYDFRELIKVVLSANIVTLLSPLFISKSFIYKRKSKGPNIEPWGTPVRICFLSVRVPFSSMYCHLSDHSNKIARL